MEINIKIHAEERLLNVLERLTKTMGFVDTKEQVDVVTAVLSQEAGPEFVEPAVEGEDLTKAGDGKPYDQFQEMSDAFDVLINKGRHQDVKGILSKYSSNGEYGGVAPKDWGRAIALAKELVKTSQKAEKKYTLEDVRELARSVQLAKGKEVLQQIFQEAGKSKLSQFAESDYGALMKALQEVM